MDDFLVGMATMARTYAAACLQGMEPVEEKGTAKRMEDRVLELVPAEGAGVTIAEKSRFNKMVKYI